MFAKFRNFYLFLKIFLIYILDLWKESRYTKNKSDKKKALNLLKKS